MRNFLLLFVSALIAMPGRECTRQARASMWHEAMLARSDQIIIMIQQTLLSWVGIPLPRDVPYLMRWIRAGQASGSTRVGLPATDKPTDRNPSMAWLAELA